jgi:cytosine deaminase
MHDEKEEEEPSGLKSEIGNDLLRDSSQQEFLEAAIAEARKSLAEGGIPIGAVLVKDGRIIGRGRNKRVQTRNRMNHAEIDCLADALEHNSRGDVGGSTIYVTHMPCAMCAGAIIHYGVSKVVAAESRTFPQAQGMLEHEGIGVLDLDHKECRLMLESFIENHKGYWEDAPEKAWTIPKAETKGIPPNHTNDTASAKVVTNSEQTTRKIT